MALNLASNLRFAKFDAKFGIYLLYKIGAKNLMFSTYKFVVKFMVLFFLFWLNLMPCLTKN